MSCPLNSRAALTAGGENGLVAPSAFLGLEDDDQAFKQEHPNLNELINTHAKFETA